MTNWISVDDRLPKYSGFYLVCDSSESPSIEIMDWDSVNGWKVDPDSGFAYRSGFGYEITHWSELPELPGEE